METKNTATIFYITHWDSPTMLKTKGGDNWETVILSKFPNKHNLFFASIIMADPFELSFHQKNNDLYDNNNNQNYKIERPGSYIIFQNELYPINNTKEISKKCIIFTDLDDTLLGDDVAIKEFNKFWLQNYFFDENKILVYNTGRTFKCVVSLFLEGILCPHYIIASTGSELYYYDDKSDSYELDEKWKEIIYDEWDPNLVFAEMNKFPYLEGFHHDTRICFEVNLEDIEKNIDEIASFKQELEKTHGLQIQLLIYGQGPKRYLEFLSKNAGKGYVIEYLCKINSVGIEDSLGFGDSLNDVQMFRTCGKAFMVANSQDGLVDWYKNEKSNLKNSKLKFCDKSYAWVLLDEIKKL